MENSFCVFKWKRKKNLKNNFYIRNSNYINKIEFAVIDLTDSLSEIPEEIIRKESINSRNYCRTPSDKMVKYEDLRFPFEKFGDFSAKKKSSIKTAITQNDKMSLIIIIQVSLKIIIIITRKILVLKVFLQRINFLRTLLMRLILWQ